MTKRRRGQVGPYHVSHVRYGRVVPTFEARIFRDGKHVLDVSNDGMGGENRYYSPDPDRPFRFSPEEKELETYAQEFYGIDYPESASLLVEFMVSLVAMEQDVRVQGVPVETIIRGYIDGARQAGWSDDLIPVEVAYIRSLNLEDR